MPAFAGACAEGALANLGELSLNSNQIANAGIRALASACASAGRLAADGYFLQFMPRWALPQLTLLSLGHNRIGDAGVDALAAACAGGALPRLANVKLQANPGVAKVKPGALDDVAKVLLRLVRQRQPAMHTPIGLQSSLFKRFANLMPDAITRRVVAHLADVDV